VTRVLIGDFRTGRRILDLPFSSVSWDKRRNRPETLSVTTTLLDPDVRALDLRNAGSPVKAFMAVLEGDYFCGAGPIWGHEYDQDSGALSMTAAGAGSWLHHRTVLPALAAGIDPALFVVPDPADTSKTMANPALATTVTGAWLGTIMKRLVQQALSWPGGGAPFVLPDDVAGIHERTYDGLDLIPVGEAIEALGDVENGPDHELTPRFASDRLGVEWLLRHGSPTQPQLRATAIHRWDLSAASRSARGLKVTVDGSSMTGLAWATGGRSSDSAIVERFTGNALTAAGYPLLETVDSSHTSVSERATLRSYAAERVRLGQTPGELWTFEVRKDSAPSFGEYGIGDLCKLIIRNDPFIPDGDYVREIAGLSGDEGDWVKITTTEKYG
jgi:hypothetical protein